MPDFNATCPFCGENSLKGSVMATWFNIPLNEDGYAVLNGSMLDQDLTEITCSACNRPVNLEHYLLHEIEVPCDCLVAARAGPMEE